MNREEQHDDKMLYELLRCIKALTTTEIGKSALRLHYPKPFPALSSLLFSEKKPGDLAPRQLMVELWLYLFDLFPSPSSTPSARQPGSRPTSVRFDSSPFAGAGPDRRLVNATDDIRGLLTPEIPDPTLEQHSFITVFTAPKCSKPGLGN